MPLDQPNLRPGVSMRGYGRDQHAGWGDVSLEVFWTMKPPIECPIITGVAVRVSATEQMSSR